MNACAWLRPLDDLAGAQAQWGIENRLHWNLDVTFREDENRVRKNHAAENLSRVRRLALNLLQSRHQHAQDQVEDEGNPLRQRRSQPDRGDKRQVLNGSS